MKSGVIPTNTNMVKKVINAINTVKETFKYNNLIPTIFHRLHHHKVKFSSYDDRV